MMVAKKKKKRIKKKKKPKFSPLNLGHKKKVKPRWRKPRGTANKKRRKYEFAGAMPNAGYRNRKETRGLRKDGKREILVRNLKDMEMLKEKKNVVAKLAAALGARKRSTIAKKAKEYGIEVLNYKEDGGAHGG
jgi:large subunit ribosomal protein L32e